MSFSAFTTYLPIEILRDMCEQRVGKRPRSRDACTEILYKQFQGDPGALLRNSGVQLRDWNKLAIELGANPRNTFEKVAAELFELLDTSDDDPDVEDKEWSELEEGKTYALTEDKLAFIKAATISQIRGPIFELPESTSRQDPLFPHQERAVNAFLKNDCSGVLHMPTGAGKTRVAIEIMAHLLNNDPNHRIIWDKSNNNLKVKEEL